MPLTTNDPEAGARIALQTMSLMQVRQPVRLGNIAERHYFVLHMPWLPGNQSWSHVAVQCTFLQSAFEPLACVLHSAVVALCSSSRHWSQHVAILCSAHGSAAC